MRRPSALLCFAVIAVAACSSTDDPRAPFKPTCLVNCNPQPGGGAVGPSQEGGTGGSAATDGGVRTLSAQLWTLSDRSFVTRAPYDGAGTLAVQGPTFAIETEFTESPVTVEGVEVSDIVWVAAVPARGTQDVLTTVQAVSGLVTPVDVDIARRSVMEDVLAGSTLANPPPVLDATRAQLVITFVDRNELPLRDLEITQHNGDAVLYDLGESYGDTITSTGERGTSVVVNARPRRAPAGSAFPGGTLVLTYRRINPAAHGSLEVYAAPGAVTFVRVRITQ